MCILIFMFLEIFLQELNMLKKKISTLNINTLSTKRWSDLPKVTQDSQKVTQPEFGSNKSDTSVYVLYLSILLPTLQKL